MKTIKPDRITILNIIISTLKEIIKQKDLSVENELEESTILLGIDSVFDSIILVTLVADIEEKIEDNFDIFITIVDEKAMSLQQSPFLTIQSLCDYVCLLINQEISDS